MSKILVTYASKYGATAEIADKVSAILKNSGFEVDILSVKKVDNIDTYDSVVIGSAVYIGQWRKAIKAFIKTQDKKLAKK